MTSRQLEWIKDIQKEFKDKFGSKLAIDWREMKGLSPYTKIVSQEKILVERVEIIKYVPQIIFLEKKHKAIYHPEIIDNLALLYKVDMNVFRNKMVIREKGKHLPAPNETLFMQAVSKICFLHKWNPRIISEYINRDRSVIYYYHKLDDVRLKMKNRYQRKKIVKKN